MSDQNKSIIVAIKHFLNSHPEIAPEIERHSAHLQGKTDQDFHNFNEWKRYQGLSTQQIFEKIYREGHWGRRNDGGADFFSGTGSHDDRIVGAYISSVSEFVKSLQFVPSVVDIGCGDFNVGSKIRPVFDRYIAVDIVSDVIESNKNRFNYLNVDFRVLNIIEQEPPSADVITIRQVFQHLSNAEISSALRNLQGKFRHLIVTEHLPPGGFAPNIDKTTGRGIRIRHNSGVVLSEPPFSLIFRTEKVLCEMPELGGIIRTTVYSA